MTTDSAPKKSIAKKLFIVIGIVLAMLGVDHLTFNLVPWGGTVTLTDSTFVVTPDAEISPADTTEAILIDTTKTDSTK